MAEAPSQLARALQAQIQGLQQQVDALPGALFGVNSDQGSTAQSVSDTVRRRFECIDLGGLAGQVEQLGEAYGAKIKELEAAAEAQSRLRHETVMELEIRHKAEMQELQVKVDLKELEWRGALQSKDDEHAKELEALKVEKRKVARQAETGAMEKAQELYEKRMEEIYREINSLGDIVEESIMGSPGHNPGGGSGGTLTVSQRAIQDALTLLRHRVAYFMQDNLASLFKGHDLILPGLNDTDNTGKIHLNSGSLERAQWEPAAPQPPPILDEISPISRNQKRPIFEDRAKGGGFSESNTERRLLRELMKVDETIIQREPNQSVPPPSSKQRTRHFSDTISTSRQRAREIRAQAPDLLTRTRSSQAQELADFLDDELSLALASGGGRQRTLSNEPPERDVSPPAPVPFSPARGRSHPKVPPIAGLLQMRSQEESKLRYTVTAAAEEATPSSSIGLNEGFVGESKEEPVETEGEQEEEGKELSSDMDSKMLQFIRRVQDTLEEERSAKGERSGDLTQQLSEYLNIDLNKLSLSQREKVVYSMINPQFTAEDAFGSKEVRLQDLLKVSRSGSEFKLPGAGDLGELALAHIESVGDAMAQKLIRQFGLESNKSKHKGGGGGPTAENSERLNTNGEFDQEVRGIVERAGILHKLQHDSSDDKERRILKQKFNQVQASPPSKPNNMFKARRGSGVLDRKQEENLLGEMQQIAKQFDEHPSHFLDISKEQHQHQQPPPRRPKQKSPLPMPPFPQQASPLDFDVVNLRKESGTGFEEEEDSLMQQISNLQHLGNQVRRNSPPSFEPLFSRGHYEREALLAEQQKSQQSRENTVAIREHALLDLKHSLERRAQSRRLPSLSPEGSPRGPQEVHVAMPVDISPGQEVKKQRLRRMSPKEMAGKARQPDSASKHLSQKAREAQRRYLTPDLDHQGRQQVPRKSKPKSRRKLEVLKSSSLDQQAEIAAADSHHSSFNSEASRFLKRREAQSPILTGSIREEAKQWVGGSAQSSIGYTPTSCLLDVNKSVDSALMRANFQTQMDNGPTPSGFRKAAAPQLASPKLLDRSKPKSQIRSAMGYYEQHNFGGGSFQNMAGHPSKTPMRASVTPENMLAGYSVTPPNVRGTPGLPPSTIKSSKGGASPMMVDGKQRKSAADPDVPPPISSPGEKRPSLRIKKRNLPSEPIGPATRMRPSADESGHDSSGIMHHAPPPPSKSFDQAQPPSSKKRPGLLLKNFVRAPLKLQAKGPLALKRPSSAKMMVDQSGARQNRPSAPIPGAQRLVEEEEKGGGVGGRPLQFHYVSPGVKYQKPSSGGGGAISPLQPDGVKRPLGRGGHMVGPKSRISSANAARPKIPMNAISFITKQKAAEAHNLSMQERPRGFERMQFKKGAAAILEGLQPQF